MLRRDDVSTLVQSNNVLSWYFEFSSKLTHQEMDMNLAEALTQAMVLAGGEPKGDTLLAAKEELARNQRWVARLRDGTRVVIRAIRKQDIAMERRFIERLSPQSRRFRFLGSMTSPSTKLLEQLVDIDPTRDVALIAVIVDGAVETEVGVARLSASLDGEACEFAVTVSDEWQHQGLGTLLMQKLIDSALMHGLTSMYSIDAAENTSMQEFAEHLGFHRRADPNDSTQVIHSLDLKPKLVA